MEFAKVATLAIIATFVMVAGPFVFALAVAEFVPLLGAPALGIGLVAFPVLGCKIFDWAP